MEVSPLRHIKTKQKCMQTFSMATDHSKQLHTDKNITHNNNYCDKIRHSVQRMDQFI